jgi:RNA polymerase sigma factor (sigma-70 family)
LERAHIVPWHKSKEHRQEDLICLCANCHERADKEGWGEKVLREYKQRPWVSRQHTSPSLGPRLRVQIVIDKAFSDFDEHDADIFRHALASFLQVSPSSIRIVEQNEGSVRLIVELPEQAADLLVHAYQNEDPELDAHLRLHPIREVVPVRNLGDSKAQVLAHPEVFRSGERYISGGRLTALAENTVVPALVDEYEDRFREIFNTYYGPVSYYFSRAGFPRDEARDLAQETFLNVYRGLGAFRSTETFETWLFKIARNVTRNAHRVRSAVKHQGKSGQQVELSVPSLGGESLGSLDLDPLDEVIERERKQLLRDAISELPPRMKSALVMRLYSDMRYQDIAAVLGISIGTVKAHLHQARTLLRNRLSEYFNEIET